MALQELINYYTTPTASDAFWLEARQLQTDHLFNETGRLSSYNHEYIYIASINTYVSLFPETYRAGPRFNVAASPSRSYLHNNDSILTST